MPLLPPPPSAWLSLSRSPDSRSGGGAAPPEEEADEASAISGLAAPDKGSLSASAAEEEEAQAWLDIILSALPLLPHTHTHNTLICACARVHELPSLCI